MFYLLLFLCGCLTGVSAVLFGFGGGFVVVPLLYYLLQLGRAADDPLAQAAMQVAVATSTCVMIVNAALATYRHRRAGSLLRAY
ncbi:TSUP family transporter, partial [Pseudomonas aeruginosa]